LSLYGTILKIHVEDVRMHVTTRFHIEGSALKGTIEGRPLGFDVRVELESSEPPERVANLLRTAEASCYVLQSLLRPVEVNRAFVLNGAPRELGAEPSPP
jgi:hypothetical protein